MEELLRDPQGDQGRQDVANQRYPDGSQGLLFQDTVEGQHPASVTTTTTGPEARVRAGGPGVYREYRAPKSTTAVRRWDAG